MWKVDEGGRGMRRGQSSGGGGGLHDGVCNAKVSLVQKK